MRKPVAVLVVWIAAAGLAVAQTPAPESVTVTGTREQTISSFIRSIATPTHMTGKMARWETPICPRVQGIKDDAAKVMVDRLKQVAREAGARVNGRGDCDPNIEIAFTDRPQATMDQVKENQPAWLGYHLGIEERDRLALVSRPIQAWYSTATSDLRGKTELDTPATTTTGPGAVIIVPCQMAGGNRKMAAAGQWCRKDVANARIASVTGSKLDDGLHSVFDHIIILVDTNQLSKQEIASVNDYAAMLALTQLSSLDKCQSLPSIVNLLPPGCQQAARTLSASDMAYLRGLYRMNANLLAQGQKNHIAEEMEKALASQ